MEDKWGFMMIGLAVIALIYAMTTGMIDAPSIKANIPYMMHQTIDPISPTFLIDTKTSCVAMSAEWVEDADNMGCYGMPSGVFDSTNCLNNPVYVQLSHVCSGLGATWVCTANDVACYY